MSPGGRWVQGSRDSVSRFRIMLIGILLAMGFVSGVAEAQFQPRIVREGTLSIGLQGQFGGMVGGEFSDDFSTGFGIGVPLRYRLSRNSALGVTFAGQRYEAKEGLFTADSIAVDWFTSITTSLEYYQFFRVRDRTPRYLFIGAGLSQTRTRLADGQTEFPGDGGVLTLGGGTEIWWKRTLTVDLSLRYNGLVIGGDDGTNFTHTIQVGLGFQFYASK